MLIFIPLQSKEYLKKLLSFFFRLTAFNFDLIFFNPLFVMKKLTLLFLLAVGVHSACISQTSITMDPRVHKHYTQDELKEIETADPAKLKALNYYYSSSFIIHDGLTGGTVDPSTVDVTEFEHLRQESKRAITGLSRNGATIELLSRNELKIRYKELAISKN